MSLPSYTVWFRGKPACPCLATWIPWFEKVLVLKGVIKESVDIAQLIGSAAASANTHSTGGAFDIWQHDDVTVWVARQMGAPATWARTTGSFATNQHTHGVLKGCPHNSAAAYQIDEVEAGGDGLVGFARDTGPRPIPDRTWREGIEWAKTQLEDRWDEMATKDEIRQVVREEIAGLKKAERDRFRRLRDQLKRRFKATDADLDANLDELGKD